MIASIKDVANKAGVSTATVSHVINDTRYVAEATKNRVYNAMKELDYRPNSIARSLRSSRSQTIGLLVPVMGTDTSNFFFMSIAQGIQSKLKEHGYNLVLSNSNEQIENEIEQIKVFNAQLIDGLIMAPTGKDHSFLKETLSGHYPVVFIDRKPIGYEGDCVLVENFSGTYDAIDRLIKKGHDKIGFLSGELGLTTSDERIVAYKQALMDHDIPVDDTLIKIGDATFEDGYDLIKEIMTQQKITALFVANNVMTMGAIAYLQEHQIQIPEQLAVIGYDDYDWAKITSPPLTVIKQPAYELGEKAAEALLQRIGSENQEFQDYRLSTELVEREST